MRNALVFSVLLHALGCAGCAGLGARAVRPTYRPGAAAAAFQVPDTQCVSWLSARRTWNAVGIGAGALAAGGGGVAALAPDSDAARVSGGITALAFGALGMLAVALGRSYAEDFGTHCQAPPAE
jgi:hypothetical protein